MFKRRVGELAKRPHIVPADATVSQAADLMISADVSCLAAVTGAKVVGFITERDLVRRLDVDLDPSTSVREFIARNAGGIPKNLAVDEALKQMLERHARHLPVVDIGGSLLGLVTDTELVDALAVDFMVENVDCRALMRAEPIRLSPDRTVQTALDHMRAQNAGSVLVVANGKAVGIFTERDALRTVVGRPERLAEPLSSHMSKPVICVPVDAMVYKVILYMRQKGVRRLAVCEADGTLAGQLSQQDILLYARRMG